MNVIVPVLYKNSEYLVEYNEPDVIAGMKEYTVRIVSINDRSHGTAEMEEQTGKEFTFQNSDLKENNTSSVADQENNILEVLIKAYRDHIAKDVSGLHRV
jgi:ferric iron reductase protein FhuF